MSSNLHLNPRYVAMVETILRTHAPDVDVWAYGSRVKGTHREGSDLDLALRGPHKEPLAPAMLYALNEAFEESTLPLFVQVHDWARLPERFQREIEREYVVVQAMREGLAEE